MPNFKDKENLKSSKRETVTYKGSLIRLAPDFSAEKPQASREWQEIFQIMKSKGLQPRLLYPARLSIKMEGTIRTCPDKKRLKEYTSMKPALQDMLRDCFKKMKEKSERERSSATKGKNGNE